MQVKLEGFVHGKVPDIMMPRAPLLVVADSAGPCDYIVCYITMNIGVSQGYIMIAML